MKNTIMFRYRKVSLSLGAIFLGLFVFSGPSPVQAAGVDSYTKILNHFDVNYSDSINTSRTYTSSGTSLSTVNKFGGHSLDVRSEGAYLKTVVGVDDFQFGSGPFTIDLWVYPTVAPEQYYSIIGTRYGTSHFLPFRYDSGSMFMKQNSTNLASVSNVNNYLTTNTWHHIAAQRSGNTFNIFIDGIQRSSQSSTISSIGGSGWPIFYGTGSDGDLKSQDFKGYMDEVRVSKGIARYSVVGNGARSFYPSTSAYGLDAPTVTGISPSTGRTTGGTSVIITGTLFEAGTDVFFDSTELTNCTYVNATIMSCTTPAHVVGSVDVTVSNSNGTSVVVTDGFTYYETTITDVSPENVAYNGGETVTITGTSFLSGATVTVGGVPATVTSNNGSRITITTPPMSAGIYDLTVTNPSAQDSGPVTEMEALTYFDPPTISTVTPDGYRNIGDDDITLTGTNFYNGLTGLSVLIAGQNCKQVVLHSNTELTCKVTAGDSSITDVTVTTGAGSVTLPGAYELTGLYYTKLLLHMDGTAGSTSFPDSTVYNHSVVPAGSASVLSGGKFDGKLEGRLMSEDHDDWYLDDDFTIDFWVNFSTLADDMGGMIAQYDSTSGDTFIMNLYEDELKLTIRNTDPEHTGELIFSVPWSPTTDVWYHLAVEREGTNFYMYRNGTRIGTTASSIVMPNIDGALTMGGYTSLLISHDLKGYMDEVRISKGIARYGGNNFSVPTGPYETDVALTQISPTSGPRVGGIQATLTGSGFLPSVTSVSFNSASDSDICSNLTVVNDNNIQCDIPALDPDIYDVVIVTPNHGNTTLPGAYVVHPFPSIDDIVPNFGSPSGSTQVSIRGTDIRYITDVKFDGISCNNIVVQSTEEITCQTPAHVSGVVNVGVYSTGTSISLADAYTYTLFNVVQKLGNGLTDYVLSAGSEQQIIFSKNLDQASKDSVINMVLAGADENIDYSWTVNGDEQILTLNGAADHDITFENDVMAVVTSVDGDTLQYPVLIDSALSSFQTDSKRYTTRYLNSEVTEMVLSKDFNQSISSTTEILEDTTIDFNPLIYINAGTIPAVNVSNKLGGRTVQMQFQAGTDLSGHVNWDQKILMPKASTAVIPTRTTNGTSIIVQTAFTVGSEQGKINFPEEAVRIELANESATNVGYFDGVNLFALSECSADSALVGNALGADEACYIRVGSSMVIWTKHFSEFVAYIPGLAPGITDIDPATGDVAGGTPVTISGTNFGSEVGNPPTVTLGGVACTDVDVDISGTFLTCTTGPHDEGEVDVVVINPAGGPDNTGTLEGGFTYTTDGCSGLGPNQVCGTQIIDCVTKTINFTGMPDDFQIGDTGSRYVSSQNDAEYSVVNSAQFDETVEGDFSDDKDFVSIVSNTAYSCGDAGTAVSLTVGATPFVNDQGQFLVTLGSDAMVGGDGSAADYWAIFSVITSDVMSCGDGCVDAQDNVESNNGIKNGQNNYFAAAVKDDATLNAGYESSAVLVDNLNQINTVTLYEASTGFEGTIAVPGLDFNLALPANLQYKGSFTSTVTYTLS